MLEIFKKMYSALVGGGKTAPTIEVAAEAVVETPAESVIEVETLAPELAYLERCRHVVAEGNNWVIKVPGKEEAIEAFALKKDAIAAATEMCKDLKGELFIHRKDGKIQNRNSFGNDSKNPG